MIVISSNTSRAVAVALIFSLSSLLVGKTIAMASNSRLEDARLALSELRSSANAELTDAKNAIGLDSVSRRTDAKNDIDFLLNHIAVWNQQRMESTKKLGSLDVFGDSNEQQEQPLGVGPDDYNGEACPPTCSLWLNEVSTKAYTFFLPSFFFLWKQN